MKIENIIHSLTISIFGMVRYLLRSIAKHHHIYLYQFIRLLFARNLERRRQCQIFNGGKMRTRKFLLVFESKKSLE